MRRAAPLLLAVVLLAGCKKPPHDADCRVIIVHNDTTLSLAQFAQLSARFDIVVVGETHRDAALLSFLATWLRELSATAPRARVVGWEFLAQDEQGAMDERFARFQQGLASPSDLVPLTDGGEKNLVYAPVLTAVRDTGARLLGVNTTRQRRHEVLTSGYTPSLFPAGFELGDAAYRGRFEREMAAHVAPEQRGAYFLAHCLSDDVMAAAIAAESASAQKILLVGAFHSDFFSGVGARLHARAPLQSILTVSAMRVGTADELLPNKLGADGQLGRRSDVMIGVSRACAAPRI